MDIERIVVNNVDVFLEDMGSGKGKITISDTYNHNYSYFWGAMGGTLKEFLSSINKEYFASKLMGSRSDMVMDVKGTFAELRKFIATELDLPWYKHREFQKDMREKIKSFQTDIEEHRSQEMFISMFHYRLVESFSYYLIDDSHEAKSLEKSFKYISEPWQFIQQTEGPEYLWLTKFHGQLKKVLSHKEELLNPL